MISAMSLVLMGCSLLPETQIQTVTDVQRTIVPIVPRPKPVDMIDVKIHVVNKDNYDEFVQEFTNKNGSLVYVALSVKDYENLSINFAEIKRYIEQQNEIIVYYEEAVGPNNEDAP